jgi:hypothetical protein
MAEGMSVPGSKAELLAFMQDQWNGFVAASDALPDEVWLGPVDAAGWCMRDHVGHVTIWIRAETALLAGGTPIPESTGMPDEIWDSGDTDARNAWFRQTIVDTPPAQIRAERDRVFPKLVEVVSGMTEEDLTQPARLSGLEDSDRPLLEIMTENYGLHFDDHRAQIEHLGRAAANLGGVS